MAKKQKAKIALGVIFCVLGVSVGSILPDGLTKADEEPIKRTSEFVVVSEKEIAAENEEEFVIETYSEEESAQVESESLKMTESASEDLAADFYTESEGISGYAVEEGQSSIGGTYGFPANGNDGFITDAKVFIQDAEHTQNGSFVLSDLAKNQFVLYVSMNIDAKSYRALQNETRSYQFNLASMDDTVFTWEKAGKTSGDISIRINNSESLYKIGSYQLLNGILTITFESNNDAIFDSLTTIYDVYVGIGGSVLEGLSNGEYEYSIPGFSYQLTVDLSTPPEAEEVIPGKQLPEILSKAGSYTKDTDKMHWTVKILYGDLSSDTKMYFYDEAAGQVFVDGSFQVEGVAASSGVLVSYEEALDKMMLSYDLSQTGQDGYVCVTDIDQDGYITISYDTVCSAKAIQLKKTTYENEAYLNLDPSKKVSATCQVSEKEWIHKSGNYSNATNSVTWTLTIDKKNRSVEKDIVITDTLPEGIVLDTASVKCDKASISASVDGNVVTFVIPKEKANFDTAKVTYKTNVSEQYVLENGNITFVNQAKINMTFTDGTDIEYGASGSVTVPVISLDKTAVSYDAKTHRITWQVVVNSRGYDYKDQVLTLTDRYEQVGGMTTDKTQVFVKDSLSSVTVSSQNAEIKNVAFEKINAKNEPVSSELTAQYYYNEGLDQNAGYDDELIFYLKNIGNQKLVFKYQTEVTNDAYTIGNQSGNFKNQITLSVGGVTTSTLGTQKVASTVLNKDVERSASNNWSPYHEDTALIDWRIEVNESGHELRNVSIIDEASAGHKIMENSIVITNAGGSQIVLPQGSISFSADDKKMEIHFGDIAEHYTIHYQTKVVGDELSKEQHANAELKNTVSMKSDSTKKEILATDNGSFVISYNDCEKTASYIRGNNVIQYEVLINESRKELENAVLKDVMSEGLSLRTNTVKLETKAGVLVDASTYSYNYDADTRTLTMTLPKNSTEYYVLKYDVKIEAGTKTAINHVTVENGDKTYHNNHTISNIAIADSFAGGNGNRTESESYEESEKTEDEIKPLTTLPQSSQTAQPSQTSQPSQSQKVSAPQSANREVIQVQEAASIILLESDEMIVKKAADENNASASKKTSPSKKKNDSNLVTILDDDVALANGVSSLPKTGESGIFYVIWMVAVILILAGIYMVVSGRNGLRKEREVDTTDEN